LKSDDCIFFDDTKENIIAAKKIGINSVLFADASEVEEYI
jgi:HAD superfamily hydrolase (TIGR01509 family)